MSNQKLLEYVNDAMSKIAAPDEIKIRLGNELIKYMIKTSKYTSIDEITNKLGSPEKLAEKMSHKLVTGMNKELRSIFTESDKQNAKSKKTPDRSYREVNHIPNYDKCISRRRRGEYTREERNVDIKLLYIPLIQISSGVEKIHYYLMDDECY